MKKLFLSLMAVLATSSLWADDITVGISAAIDDDAKTIAAESYDGYNDGSADIITNGGAVYGAGITAYKATGSNRTYQYNGTGYVGQTQWRKSINSSTYNDTQWAGCNLTIADGYKFSVTKAHARIVVADDTYTWKVVVMDASDVVIYESKDKTTKKASSTDFEVDFTSAEMAETLAKMTDLIGNIKLRIYMYQGGGTKYFTIPNLQLTGTVSADTRTRYAMTTSASPAAGGTVSPVTGTDIAEGCTATFTATPATGYKFGSWLIDDAEQTANPYQITNVTAAHTAVANFIALPAITYSNGGDTEVVGTLPTTEYVESGDSYTIPTAYFLYKPGYYLAGWTDGTNTYKAGESVPITGDLALTPVYTANAKALGEFEAEVVWNFGESDATTIVLEGAEGCLVKQVTAGDVTYDFVLGINTVKGAFIDGVQGKFNNAGKASNAQVNKGTVFTVPAVKGMQVIYTYTTGAPTVDQMLVDGVAADSVSETNKQIYYTYKGDAASVSVVDALGDIYPSSLAVKYPIAESGNGGSTVNPITGLAALIKSAVEGAAEGAKSVTVDLTEDIALDSIYDPGLMSVVINGNNHTVTVNGGQIITQAGLEVNNVNFQCTGATQAPIAMSANPDSALLGSKGFYAKVNDDESLSYGRQNAFYDTCAVVLKGCNFADLQTSLFSTNKTGWILTELTIDSCVAQFNFASGSPYISFENSANEGSLKNFTIKNSTLYNIVESNDAYFFRYANASNSQPSKAFPSDPTAYITFTNNTFVNTCSNKNFGNNTQNNNATVADLRGNVFYNIFRLQKYIQSNMTCTAFTNADNAICGITQSIDGSDLKRFATEDTLLCKTETAFNVPTAAFDFNVEALAANFSPKGRSYAHKMGYGDPRWVTAYEYPMLDDGVYYLSDMSTGLYYSRGNNYGTAAVTDYYGYPVQITADGATATLRCYDWTSSGLGDNLYADNGTPVALTITGSAADGYVLSFSGKYIKAVGANEQLTTTENAEEATRWNALSLSEYEAAVAAAESGDMNNALTAAGLTAETLASSYIVKDVSSSLQNASLSNANTGWTWTKVRGNDVTTNQYATECYQGTGVLSQTATVAPGLYRVSVQAMYRSGSNASVAALTNEGYNLSTMYMQVNDSKVRVKSWGVDRASDTNPNSMAEFSTLAADGKYYVETYANVGESGQLSVSINMNAFINSGWAIVKNVKVEMFTSQVAAEDSTALLATVPSGKMNNTVQTELETAVAAFQTAATVTNYNALEAAIAAANQSITDYAATIAAVNTYAEKVATLDADGQAAYDVSEVSETYEAGTMSGDQSAVVVEAYLDAVKSQTTAGSVWSDLCSNTWNGATGKFAGQYPERYTGDNTPCAAGDVMTQTISGLVPGATYTVSFTAIANVARNLDATTYAGEGIAYVYANDVKQDITVGTLSNVEDVIVAEYQYSITFQATEEGAATFGIANAKEGGQWYVANFTSLVLNTLDVPVELTLEPGKNISTELAAAVLGKHVASIKINLAKGGEYSISSGLTTGVNFAIYGDSSVINIPDSVSADFITLNGSSVYAMKKDSTVSDHFQMDEVVLSGIILNGLQGAVVTDAQKTKLDSLAISNSVIAVAANSANVVNFNGMGYVGAVMVENSTIYAPAAKSSFFAQYGSRPKNVNGDLTQAFYFHNSTIVNIANGKNFNDLKQKGTAQNVFSVKNSIFVDCGKQNQVLVGLDGGQASTTPQWTVEGNIFNYGGADVSAAETEKAGVETSSVAAVVTFVDAAAGNMNATLTVAEGVTVPESIGDPRWTISTEVSGINNVKADDVQKDGKFFINGKLVIVRNGQMFNANGQLIK